MRRPPARWSNWLILLFAACGWAESAIAQDEFPTETREEAPPANDRRRVPISLDGGASINPAVIRKVIDNTVGLTLDDREAYFRILKLTQKLDPDELRELALEFRKDRHNRSQKYRQRKLEKFPVFVDLFQHPDAYRGRPVTLHGYFRRLVAYDAGKNDQGFETLYEGWLYPDEGQSNPTVVIFTEKPAGLSIGGDITEEISVTGYFLKMYGYQAHDTTRKAPLILAQTVRWRPQRDLATPWQPSSQAYLAITAAIVVIALLIALGVRESRLRYEQEKQARWGETDTFQLPDDSLPIRPATPSMNGSSLEPHH